MTGTTAEAEGVGSAPSFAPDVVPDYVKALPEIQEWILDGEPARLKEEEDEEETLLRMPSFRGILTEGEVSDLSAWIAAVADLSPPPEGPARAGRDAAGRLGCFGCHGPQGRGDTPNPRSLKGYIPAWDGADFPDLARDDSEIRDWIRDGGPARLRNHPVARFFMGRQAIRMPAFGAAAPDADVEAITAYIHWLRNPPS
jgi:mono/diheme cytochrome c family protein